MLGLAALLGFETFGRLAALWGAALVAGTVLSLGGPVILLRLLTDGKGMRGRDVCKIAFVYPGLLALVFYGVANTFAPTWSWGAILGAGFAANTLGCLASVMRALGNVQGSMALRDAGPQIALGLAGILGQSASADMIAASAAMTMSVFALCGIVWVCRHKNFPGVLASVWRPYWSTSLWASSVLGMVVAQIDLIVGGAVISAEQLGVYAVLRRVANLVALPVTVATWVSALPISAAHGAGDAKALARASAQSSQIAMLPGVLFFAAGLLAIPLLTFALPEYANQGIGLTFGILLCGALVQVVFAASFGVANLCGAARYAMIARFGMVVLYLLWIAWWGPELTVTTNALGYIGALTLGGVGLWHVIWRQLGVDTSAFVLLNLRRRTWKTS
ncbi:lipopolysaccharide biosynthesis protein [Yoonia sp. GPGPB17]|uniref:lipopolysaccharide biosynthesis protein n=1 Tax=Yoonia sp. GPGPB17 TaxID=3026147 RepID=UPI0030EBD603